MVIYVYICLLGLNLGKINLESGGKMVKFKKGIAMLLLAAIFVNFPTGVAKAETTNCNHPHSSAKFSQGRGTEESRHRVYRNLYVDGVQAYSLCVVNATYDFFKIECTLCGYEQEKRTYLGATHSLANDPDH